MHHISHTATTPARNWGGLLILAILVAAMAGCGEKDDDPLAKAQREAARNPKSAEAQVALARVHAENDRLNDAFVAYRRAADLEPSNADAYLGLASVDLRLSNAEHAIKVLKEFLAKQPDNAMALDLLGRAYILRKEPEQAISAFRKALKADPKLLDASVDLVYALIQSGDLEAARDAGADAVSRHPQSAQAHYTYGDVLSISGRRGDAEKQFRAALKYDPKHAGAMTRLARVMLEEQRDYEEVRKLALAAAKIRPGDGLPGAMAAVALYKLGDTNEALSEMDIICRSNPYNPVTWALFSDLLASAGYQEEARLARAEAVKVSPRAPLTQAQRKAIGRKALEHAKANPGSKEPYVPVDPRDILGDDPEAARREAAANEVATEGINRTR